MVDKKQRACFWDNGILKLLEVPAKTNSSETRDIAIFKNEVIIVGSYSTSKGRFPCMWISGKLNQLAWPKNVSFSEGFASSCFVLDDKVYISGVFMGSLEYSCYWINGKLFSLDGREGFATEDCSIYSIFVKDKDIYTCGVIGISTAAFWKNGEIAYLTNKTHGFAEACKILVDGDRVLVIGTESKHGIVWDNGNPGQLQGCDRGKYLAIQGNEILALGFDISSEKPFYWKNGVKTSILNQISSKVELPNVSWWPQAIATLNGEQVIIGDIVDENDQSSGFVIMPNGDLEIFKESSMDGLLMIIQ
jgi:hypothetical protein